MSRYTPPSDRRTELTSDRFRGRPAWVRIGAWLCVIAVLAMALTTVMSVFL